MMVQCPHWPCQVVAHNKTVAPDAEVKPSPKAKYCPSVSKASSLTLSSGSSQHDCCARCRISACSPSWWGSRISEPNSVLALASTEASSTPGVNSWQQLRGNQTVDTSDLWPNILSPKCLHFFFRRSEVPNGHVGPRSEVSNGHNGHKSTRHFGPKVQHANVQGRLGVGTNYW